MTSIRRRAAWGRLRTLIVLLCIAAAGTVNLHQRLLHETRFETPPPAALSSGDLAAWPTPA